MCVCVCVCLSVSVCLCLCVFVCGCVCTHFYSLKDNVNANLDASDNVILGYEPSSEMLTNQSEPLE